jgi:hypothetical protein
MLCVPTANEGDGEQVAVFPVNATDEQRAVAPSLNVTVPCALGFGEAPAVTVAVNVAAPPKLAGLVPVVSANAVEVVRRAKKSLLVIVLEAPTAMPLSVAAPVFPKPLGTV